MKVRVLESIIQLMPLCNKNDLILNGVKIYPTGDGMAVCGGSQAAMTVINISESINNEVFFNVKSIDHLKAVLNQVKKEEEFSFDLIMQYCAASPEFPSIDIIEGLAQDVKRENSITVDMALILKAAKAMEFCHGDKKLRKQMTIHCQGKNKIMILESNDKRGLSIIAPIALD